ncbi:hypothetical protein FJT64_006627 [Amphibalanus amphitrite]|uniref:Lysosomal-associated transmembrane protein 4B n=1 Tax=Amphibalanus amphitrite TaxID=1232801 RepID=A0A6A4VMV6_AMPAM|nr:hypothetical protein FJT64_006627 [Amphibalanus amphitrite]
MMVLKSCRCCCGTMRLEKAAKIIGIVFTVLGVLSMVSSAIELHKLDVGSEQLLTQLGELYPHRDAERLLYHSRALLVARLCTTVLFTAICAALVVGVFRSSRPLVLAFVVLFGLYMLVSTVAIFYAFYDPSVVIDVNTIAELSENDRTMAKAIIYTSLAVILGVYGFFWYLLLVVYSYYKELAKRGPTVEHRQLF